MNSAQVIPEPIIRQAPELVIHKIPDFEPNVNNSEREVKNPHEENMLKAPESAIKTVSQQAIHREILLATNQQSPYSESLKHLNNIHFLRIEQPKLAKDNIVLLVSNYAGFLLYSIKQFEESLVIFNTANHDVMKIKKVARFFGDEWSVQAPENNRIGYFSRKSLFTNTDWRIQSKNRVDVMKFQLDTCFVTCSLCCSSLAEDYKAELIGAEKTEMGKFHDEKKDMGKKVQDIDTWKKHHVVHFVEGIQLEQKLMIMAASLIVYNANFMKEKLDKDEE